jgi:hypothetical protein
MRHKTASDLTRKPDQGSLESTEQLIREQLIGFSRNVAVNTVMISKIGSEPKRKYLERNPLRLLKQRIRKAGAERQ